MPATSKFIDKCAKCGAVAKEVGRLEFKGPSGKKLLIKLECNHNYTIDADSLSPFDSIILDNVEDCKHEWSKSVCTKCDAKKLKPFQITACREIEKANGKFADFDDMGLGKTIVALSYLHLHPERFPVLWVTKSATKFQHAKESFRFDHCLGGMFGRKHPPQIILTGKEVPLPFFKWYIVGYDIFRRTGVEVWKKAGIKCIVLDECQQVSNVDATRTQLIRAIARDIESIIPLSGSFWKNRGSEAFVVLNMLDPKRFNNYDNFKRNNVNVIYTGNGRSKEGGLRKGFIDTIKHIAIRRQFEDVVEDYAEFTKTKFECDIPDYCKKIYQEECDKVTDIMNAAVIGGEEGTFAVKAKINAAIMQMRQIVGLGKVDSTVEYAKEFLEDCDRKLVIFVHHRNPAELIFKQLSEWCAENDEPQPLKLTGTMSPIEKGQVQDQFNSPNYRLLVCSTLAGGEGLNLQTCSDSILHERQWNPQNENQAIKGRFQRIGQKSKTINCMIMHGKDSVDIDLAAIVETKDAEFHASMNHGDRMTWSEDDMTMAIAQRIAERVNSQRKSKVKVS